MHRLLNSVTVVNINRKSTLMRQLRRTVLATVAVALCAAPIAAADNHHDNSGGAVVAPARGGGLTGGELLGEDWARGLARPSSPDPFRGGCRPFVGNVLTCETEAKVSGTTLTRTTKIDLQHCSATVSQACDANSDCQSDRCPTCEVGEVCLSSDHCDGSSLGCVTDRDCEPPRCGFCDPGTTCVKVLPLSSVSIGPGETVDFIDSNVSLINVLTTPAKIKETWTARSFNAGDATTLKRYKIKPRPDVKP